MEVRAFWKTFEFATKTTTMLVSVTVIVGSGPQPTLPGLEEEVVRLAGVLEDPVRPLQARMVHVLGRIDHSRKVSGRAAENTRKISEGRKI